jgi:hypothetical protein
MWFHGAWGRLKEKDKRCGSTEDTQGPQFGAPDANYACLPRARHSILLLSGGNRRTSALQPPLDSAFLKTLKKHIK